MEKAKPGHGDHWLAALEADDPRLLRALSVPTDAPGGVAAHRSPLNAALDMVQVTQERRLVTSFPEPRATTLVAGQPVEMGLWETRVEAWMTFQHETVGALTFFATDLAERAESYQGITGERPVAFELGALAYMVQPTRASTPPQLAPAAGRDARFLPDDYWFHAEVREIQAAGDAEVLILGVHGGLEVPVAVRHRTGMSQGDRCEGFLWLTGRWPS